MKMNVIFIALVLVLVVVAVLLFSQRDSYHTEQLADAFLEFGRFSDQRTIDLQFDVDVRTARAVVGLANFAV